jgi:hypothetical protein
MPRRSRSAAEPHLFSLEPARPGLVAPAELTAAISPEPKPTVNVDDLRQVIASWTDAEVEQLHVIFTKEIHRRGRLSVEPVHVSPSAAQVKSAARQAVRQRKREVSVQEVALGQVNAVRAARGAGMKLSRIAREFGLPLATIKRVLDVSLSLERHIVGVYGQNI